MSKDLMPLQNYLADARAKHYALGGFCLWTYAYGMAIAEVAQKLNLPMLYIIGDAEVKFSAVRDAVAAAPHHRGKRGRPGHPAC